MKSVFCRANQQPLLAWLTAGLTVAVMAGCAPKVEISAKEPITINLNVKVDHEIRVKIDKELDSLFSDNSELF